MCRALRARWCGVCCLLVRGGVDQLGRSVSDAPVITKLWRGFLAVLELRGFCRGSGEGLEVYRGLAASESVVPQWQIIQPLENENGPLYDHPMINQRTLIVVVAVAVLLTGCSATAPEAKAPPPTPTSAVQGVQAAKDATGKMTPEQQDTAYLAGVHASVKTGTDADLITIGHKMCADLASGMDMAGRMSDIKAAGFASADGLAIIVSAGLVYCKA